MNIKEIKELLQMMAEHELAEVEIEKDGLKVKLKKLTAGATYIRQPQEASPMVISMPSSGAQALSGPREIAAQTKENSNSTTVRSPMVGTYYAAPAPDQAAYVAIGKRVNVGDVLCIIEAMKLMNEIKAEVSGEISEILVKNGQSLEFDQPLFTIVKG